MKKFDFSERSIRIERVGDSIHLYNPPDKRGVVIKLDDLETTIQEIIRLQEIIMSAQPASEEDIDQGYH